MQMLADNDITRHPLYSTKPPGFHPNGSLTLKVPECGSHPANISVTSPPRRHPQPRSAALIELLLESHWMQIYDCICIQMYSGIFLCQSRHKYLHHSTSYLTKMMSSKTAPFCSPPSVKSITLHCGARITTGSRHGFLDMMGIYILKKNQKK